MPNQTVPPLTPSYGLQPEGSSYETYVLPILPTDPTSKANGSYFTTCRYVAMIMMCIMRSLHHYVFKGVFIRWTGMDHWTAGMDYWNGLLDYWNEHACHKFEVSMTIVHMHACMHAHC